MIKRESQVLKKWLQGKPAQHELGRKEGFLAFNSMEITESEALVFENLGFNNPDIKASDSEAGW